MRRELALILAILLITVFLLSSLTLTSPVKITTNKNNVVIDQNWEEKISKDLFKKAYIDNEYKRISLTPYGLRVIGKIGLFSKDTKDVIVFGRGDYETTKYILANSEKLIYKFPLMNNYALYYILATPKQIVKLAKYPGVFRISPSPSILKLIKESDIYKNIGDYLGEKMVKPIIKPEQNITIDTNMGVKLIGATKVWEEYNITGKGIVVGIVDTGVDFSNPNLGLDTIARAPDGTPLLMSMNNGLVLATGRAVNINGHLNTSGLIVAAFDPLYTLIFRVPYIDLFQFQYNITVGNITSQSGIYHVGLAPYMFIDELTGYIIETFVPVVLVDSQQAGVYDEAYFDLSTSFYDLSTFMRELENETLGHIYWREPDPAWNDTSITDETPFGPGNEIVGRDFDGDGVIDFSIGTIAGYYFDSYGLATLKLNETTLNITLGTPGLYPGWDYQGRYLALVSDFHGHGTSVATVIASRGRVAYNLYGNGKLYRIMGVAPCVKLATGDAWLFGDLLLLEAWLAGYNITSSEGYFTVTPYGPHRADIISNSWSYIYISFWMQQFPGIDGLSAFMDTILSVRNYLIGDHVVIVFAAGNEGPGYSTVGAPSAGLLVITVGASTLWDFTKIYGYPEGYYDEIIPFSSRGPTGQGYPKPDVVNIGAFEWATTRTIDGRGYGSIPTVFGGTSEATPYTSGSLALVFQAYKEKYNGTIPDPITAKIILKSTAKDLWYPAFSQGSGRVDVYRAVKTVLESGWLAYVENGIQNAFLEDYYTLFGPYINYVLPALADTGYYGVVMPGTTTNFTLHIIGNGTVSISAWNTVLYKEYVAYDSVYKYDKMLFLKIPKYTYTDSDLIEVIVQLENITYPPGQFSILPQDMSHEIILSLYDWIDYNGDGQIGYPYELHYINFEARVSTEAYATISAPASKIHGDLVLRIRPAVINATPVKMKIIVRAYKYVPCKVTTYPSTVFVNGSADIPVVINIPKNFRPGILEVRLVVNTPTKRIIVPVSVLVPLVIDNTSTILIGGQRTPMRYDPFTLYGLAEPYYGVWEDQDWRILPVLITDHSISGLAVLAHWFSGYASDLTFLTVAPGGVYTLNGFMNVFATYKQSYDLGLVYNPSITDQMHGKLRMYIPVKWAEPLKQIPIGILDLSDWPPYPYLVGVQYSDRLPEIYGLYRIIYGFASYSGKVLEDKIMFRIITIKSNAEYYEKYEYNNISVGILEARFEAGAYTPFLFADLYVYTEGQAEVLGAPYTILPISILENGTLSNLTYYLVLYDIGYYVGWSPTGKYTEFSALIMYNESISNIVNAIVVMYNYPWHSEGLFLYDYSSGELLIVGYTHPGMVSATLYLGGNG
jgi:subtilisin family serine protease